MIRFYKNIIIVIFFLSYNYKKAKSPEDAEKGLLFMQEMVELSKTQSVNAVQQLQAIYFRKPLVEPVEYEVLLAGPSHFSRELTGDEEIMGQAVYAIPLKLCSGIK